MLANGRFSRRPFTIAGVMCGIVRRPFSGAVLASTPPSDLPTCAAAGATIADSARTAAAIVPATFFSIFIVMLLIVPFMGPEPGLFRANTLQRVAPGRVFIRIQQAEQSHLYHRRRGQRRRSLGCDRFHEQAPSVQARVHLKLKLGVARIMQPHTDEAR